MSMFDSTLSSISLQELIQANPYPFAALYGRDNDRRSTLIAQYIRSIFASGNSQCVFLMNPDRESQFAQQYHSTSVYFPFANDLELLGIGTDQMETHTVQNWSEFSLTDSSSSFAKPILVLRDETTIAVPPLTTYLPFLASLIGRNGAAGVATIVVVDNLSAFVNLDDQSPEDVAEFMQSVILPRQEKKVAFFMAPQLQFAEKSSVADLRAHLDLVILADAPITFAGLKMWQRQYFREFGVGSSDDELVSLFERFRVSREENKKFKALVVHRIRRTEDEFAGSQPKYLEKIEFDL